MLALLLVGCSRCVRFAHCPHHVLPGIPSEAAQGSRWGGRAKGTPNKVNQSIREAIQMAFEQVGAWST